MDQLDDFGPQLHPRAHRPINAMRRWGVSMVIALIGVGCSDSRSQDASVDSLLSRDLTLAAGEAPAPRTPSIGDTAVATTEAVVRAPERPAPSRPQPTTRPTSPPPRARRAPSQAPSAPVSSSPTAVPTPSAATVGVPATGATAASGEVAGGAALDGSAAGAAAGPSRGLSAGSILQAKTNAALCTLGNRPGDRIVATLTERITGPDGATLPEGTAVLLELAQASPEGVFTFRVRSVQVQGELVAAQGTVQLGNDAAVSERQVSKGGDRGKVVTGAIIGAIAGRVLGGGTRGTVIGAAGGAAAGTVAAARNRQTDRCLASGTMLTVTLSAPLVFPASLL